MIEYVVTTRNAKGLREERAYTAENRSDLFKKLAADGIHVISVREGTLGKKPRKAVGGGVSSKGRVFIAAAVAVLIAGVAAWLMWPEAEKPVEVKKEVKKSVKAEPVKPVKEKPVVKAEVPAKIDPNARPTKVGETVNGYIKLPSGRLHKVRGVITNSVSAVQTKGKYEIFDFHCENEIACLLTIQPGQGLVGTPRYNGRFTKEFLESLKTPIVINDDDSEEDKELKRNVNLAKQELKAAYDRGEDIEKIMLDTRREYQDLAMYKQELRQLVYEYRSTGNPSEQDVEDYVAAANKMLEAKGIAPLNIGPISRRKLMMMREEALKTDTKQSK